LDDPAVYRLVKVLLLALTQSQTSEDNLSFQLKKRQDFLFLSGAVNESLEMQRREAFEDCFE
jgi:hypothetical protein